MTDNRIRELREAKGLTQEELAERTGISVAHISRMENGKRGVSRENARKIAAALERRAAEVLGLDDGKSSAADFKGFREELTPYELGPSDPFAGLKTRNRYLMTVHTDALARMGIRNGDVVVVDGSAEICSNPPALSAVRVQYHYDSKRPGKAVTLMRQFVPPSLLITNSAGRNASSIDMETDDAQIVGVIVSSHRALHG
ncbi:MAG: helix-turn-helix transcriptional regulator [Hyphomicrobiaceae bacterium]|nr:MAG: helix-turn-helix transcriptional regulator [Hyphomicrobiaceae bacterium]